MRFSSIGQIFIASGALLLAGALWAGTEGALVAPGAADGKAGHAGKDVYGIVNLVSESDFGADVNARGQAAFQYVGLDSQIRVGFFDGERVVDISPPRSVTTLYSAFNERSEVALFARFQEPGAEVPTAFRPFRWSAARGHVPLPTYHPDGDAVPSAINKRGEIVGGSSPTPDGYLTAVRWTSANRLLPLPGGPGVTNTYAADINDSNVSVGGGADATNPELSRALAWDAAGRLIVSGTMGGFGASANFINNRGDIAGMVNINGPIPSAFLLSPGKAVVRAGPRTVANALNEAGEIVGRIQPVNSLATRAFLFSRARGLVDLQPGSYFASEALDVNDSGVAVGTARPGSDVDNRAFRWTRTGGAVDLNTRLLDPPAGLVLHEARGISANGDIVADSNVGLVLLRAGGGGTDAPVLGPLQFQRFPANHPARFTLSLRDRNVRETHTATIDWGDGAGPQAVPLRGHNGRGLIDIVHTYPEWGIYQVVVRVTDSGGRSTSLAADVWLLDDDLPVLRGKGVLGDETATHPAGMSAATSAAAATAFRLTAPLASQAGAKAAFSFHLLGKTAFRAEQLDKRTVEGNRVRLEGSGRLDGRSGYRFAIDATAGDDATQASRMAVRITQDDPAGGRRLVFQAGEGAPAGQAQQQVQAGQAGAVAQPGQASLAGVLRQGSLRIHR